MWQLEDIIFYESLSLFWDFFNRYIVAFFETSVLQEVHILRYLRNGSAMLIPKLQNKTLAYYSYTW